MNPIRNPKSEIPNGPSGLQESNFRYAFLFLPSAKREALESVYAFARRGDDVADDELSSDVAAREMARHREALDRCYAQGNDAGKIGDAPRHILLIPDSAGGSSEGDSEAWPEQDSVVSALAKCVRRYKIPRRYFDELLLGLEMDLRGAQYETFEDLKVYCYRVASTIGLISIEVFGYRNPQTRDYAANLGIALQLVNILRDLQSDAQRGRIYLPREELERFRVKPEEIAAGRPSEWLTELLRFEFDRARQYFDRAREMLPQEDRRSMVAAEIMAAIYWRLLRLIRARGYNVFGDPLRLSRLLKLRTALCVYLGLDWWQ